MTQSRNPHAHSPDSSSTTILQVGNILLKLAEEKDDPGLRKLLRRIHMGDDVSLTFERESNFFDAARIQGDFHQVICGENLRTGEIIGLGSRSIAQGFVNGTIIRLGYLSDLRLTPGYRNGRLIARGYQLLHQLHLDGRTRLYYSLIFTENEIARKVLTSKRAGLPSYLDKGELSCACIPIARGKAPVEGIKIIRGNSILMPEIVDCLNRNNARFQFAPQHDISNFYPRGRWKDFSIEDFHVALRNDRIAGVAATWDQRRYKQTRVQSYGGWMKAAYLCSKVVKTILPVPPLPFPGKIMDYENLCFVGVDDDESLIFQSLLRSITNDCAARGVRYLMAGFHEKHPFCPVLQEYLHVEFKARLYCVCFLEDIEHLKSLDSRVPHIEIATL